MTDDEELKEALKEVEKMRAEIKSIKSLGDLDSLLTSKRGRGRTKDPDKQPGEVIVRASGGIFEAGFEREPEKIPGNIEYGRTANPMRKKAQRALILRFWKQGYKVVDEKFYRKRCGSCGAFDTYQSLSRKDTEGVDVWCYTCGATDEQVTKKYVDDRVFKEVPIECVDCGNRIMITQGQLLFPTGDVDRSTGRKNYRCEGCHKGLKK